MAITAGQQAELARRIAALSEELHATLVASEASGATVELDQTRQGRLSRIDALQGQAMAQAGARRARLRLQMLAAAQARLAQPDFGCCRDCDDDIAWPRLRLDPCATRCIDCAQAREG